MGSLFAHLFVSLVTSGAIPNLMTEIEAEYQAIAKGEGGPAKVAAAAAGLGQIAGTVASVAASVTK